MHPTVALADTVAYLDELLDTQRYASEEESNGLLLDAGRAVFRLAAAVNTSFAAIRAAAAAGAQLLLVHHAAWPFIDLHLREEKLAALRLSGISLYGAHAALDCAPQFGNSWVLARDLGVAVEGTFLDYHGGHAGVFGRAEGTFEGFVGRARRALGVEVESWRNSDSFGRVGIVAGAAGETTAIDEARRLGCDTYLTGEGSMFTRLFARETGVNLVLGGHWATEAPGIKALAQRAAQHFRLPWSFIPEEPPLP